MSVCAHCVSPKSNGVQHLPVCKWHTVGSVRRHLQLCSRQAGDRLPRNVLRDLDASHAALQLLIASVYIASPHPITVSLHSTDSFNGAPFAARWRAGATGAPGMGRPFQFRGGLSSFILIVLVICAPLLAGRRRQRACGQPTVT